MFFFSRINWRYVRKNEWHLHAQTYKLKTTTTTTNKDLDSCLFFNFFEINLNIYVLKEVKNKNKTKKNRIGWGERGAAKKKRMPYQHFIDWRGGFELFSSSFLDLHAYLGYTIWKENAK